MYPRTNVVQTKNYTRGIENQKLYIILHHTGSEHTKGDFNVLSGDHGVSVHFLLGMEGQQYKICDPRLVARHAGVSQRGSLRDMNKYSLGIEITGVNKFTDEQYANVVSLVKYLQETFKIPSTNILRHCDLTWGGSAKKQLRDGKSPSRKTDVNRALWADRGFDNFLEWRTQTFS